MSGSNPFRRRDPGAGTNPQPQPPPRGTANEAGGGRSNRTDDTDNQDDSPARPAPRPQKTVRIASPPVPAASPPSAGSPSDSTPNLTTFKGQPIAHRGSPPPPSRIDSDDVKRGGGGGGSPVDPFSLGADASGSDDESPNTGTTVDWTPESSKAGSSFSHLDRSLQASHRRSSSNNDATPGPPPSAEAAKGKRATMDVDAFKRLLMTGDTDTGSGSTQPLGQDGGQTGPAPKSKEEILEHYNKENPAHTLNSPDQPPKSASRAGSGEKKKPPPPKTRHGKPIQSSDETAATSSLSPPNKHSEPTPSDSSNSTTQDPSGKLPQRNPSNSSTNAATDASSPKLKRPPTPPLTRRHSQMKHSGVSRSSSTRSTPTNAPDLARRSSMPKAPPAPPSPRRPDRDSSVSGLTPLASGHRRASSGQDSSLEQDSEESSLHRSDSSSIKGASALSPRKTPGPNLPPPPPPPRRRTGGNRTTSEDTQPNSSTATDTAISEDTEDRASKPLPPEPSQAGDVLADLSRLQREVDDLRGQYDQRKPSG